MAHSILTGNGDRRRALVVVFLRGGADGLNLVVPHGDDGYFRARKRIAITREQAVPLDGFFGLNPLLAPLERAWKDGALALVHAVGSEDGTRSHFEAQDLMEHGGLNVAGGWLGRFLRTLPQEELSGLSAVAIGDVLPEALRGAPNATVLRTLEAFTLGDGNPGIEKCLQSLYAEAPGLLGEGGRMTLRAMQRIRRMRLQDYVPSRGASYPDSGFGRGLREIAQLIKARVGVVTACLDLDGWDSHFTQWLIMDPLMKGLGEGLDAFYRDMGPEMDTTSLVVMTEFGCRVYENASFGTDHGRGSVLFLMGGGVHGGKVYGAWPGLGSDVLEGPGDLPVTTNYRNVLAAVLARHGASGQFGTVFPGFSLAPLPI